MSLTAQQFERTYNAIQTGNAIIEKRQDGKDWITISTETSQETIFDWLVAEGMAFLGAGKYASPLSVFLSIMSPTTMGTAILPKNDFILKPKEKITMRGDALIKRLFPTPPIVQSGQSKVPTLLMPTPIPKPVVKPPIAKPVTPKPVAKQKVAKTVVKPVAAKPVIKPAKPVPKISAANIQKQLERDRERQLLEERQRKEREKLTSERIKNEREARIQRYRDQEKQRNERDAARRKADDQRQRENRQKEEENRRKAVVSHKRVMENYRAREEARRKADDQRRRDNRKKEEEKKAPQARYITAQKQRQQIGGAYSSVRFFSSTSSTQPSLCGDTKGIFIPHMKGTYRK